MDKQVIDGPFHFSSSFYVPSTGSTMDEARVLSPGRARGCVMAGEQTAGRGRLAGRSWHGEPGASLLATFWFPSGEFGGAPLPLVSGLAVLRACEAWASTAGAVFGRGLRLKWPNDALCGGRKLAGILCESSGDTVYAGIGVNCGQASFGLGFRTEPTSILLETGMKPDPADLLARLSSVFASMRGIGGGWLDEYRHRLVWLGEPVRFRPGLGEAEVDGILEGVDGTGAVVISGKAWSSGELTGLIDVGAGT